VFYTQDRTQQRQFLANAWQKFLNKEGLDPLETQLTLGVLFFCEEKIISAMQSIILCSASCGSLTLFNVF
jgi:hypothetical protein